MKIQACVVILAVTLVSSGCATRASVTELANSQSRTISQVQTNFNRELDQDRERFNALAERLQALEAYGSLDEWYAPKAAEMESRVTRRVSQDFTDKLDDQMDEIRAIRRMENWFLDKEDAMADLFDNYDEIVAEVRTLTNRLEEHNHTLREMIEDSSSGWRVRTSEIENILETTRRDLGSLRIETRNSFDRASRNQITMAEETRTNQDRLQDAFNDLTEAFLRVVETQREGFNAALQAHDRSYDEISPMLPDRRLRGRMSEGISVPEPINQPDNTENASQ